MSDTLVQTPVTAPAYQQTPPARPLTLRRWLLHDSPYILMLVLALAGVTFRMQILYWLALTPLFGIICIVAGWGNAKRAGGRLQLVYSQILIWAALILAIYVFYNNGAQGILNPNANPLAMVTLLALGTFVAGVQARLWETCAVGAVLFLALPGISWLNQSALLLDAIALAVIILGGLTWWFSERRRRTA
jgi:hypothetical protein